jgi:hypothetical protein
LDSVFLPSIDFGVDKIANTFVFTGNAALSQRVFQGTLSFYNQYRGSAFRTVTTAVRDDQTAGISYRMPLFSGVEMIASGSWILSRDNRSVGLSSLERLSGVAGLRYSPTVGFVTEGFGGVEQTTQLGVPTTGPIMGFTSRFSGVQFEQFDLAGNVLLDWHQLDERRTNADVSGRLSIVRSLADGSSLEVSAGGLSLQRQYLTALSGGTTPDAVEERREDRFDASLNVNYVISPKVQAGLRGTVNANGIGRAYGEPLPNIAVSAVDRHLQELMLEVEGWTRLSIGSAWTRLGAAVYRRSEENNVDQRHAITDEALASLQAQEYQRDNRTGRLRLFADGGWTPTTNDSITAEYTWWLLQYDTPSSANTDDRDELSAVATVRYAHRFTERLTAGVTLGGQYVHLVYLQAARSAFNNENRVLRLSPFVRITSGFLRMQPQFEVLANYTVYDFEGKGASARSFGYRQLSYRDSIRVQFAPTLRLEIPALVRYFERSTLLWGDFSEIPQAGNLEYLTSLRIFSHPTAAWDVGVGIRRYTFEQRTFEAIAGIPAVINSVKSWAPEVLIRFTATGGSTLDLSGWYEFQELLPAATRELPNLLLLARVLL